MKLQTPFVICAAGLHFEARIAESGCVQSRCGRGEKLVASIEQAIGPGCAGIVSFGIAGGLDPRLRRGDLVVASAVVGSLGTLPVDQNWSAALLMRCPGAVQALVFAADEPALAMEEKERLFGETGAATIDMESHLAARIAMRHGLPFAALRVVADPAERAVPPSAMLGLRLDGSTSALAVMRGLIERPSDAFGLAGVALDAWAARRTLSRIRRALGPGFGLLDLG